MHLVTALSVSGPPEGPVCDWGRACTSRKALSVLGSEHEPAQKLCLSLGGAWHALILGSELRLGDQGGVGNPWFALIVWGVVAQDPEMLGFGSELEAQLRGFPGVHPLQISGPQVWYHTVHCLGHGGGSTWVMAGNQLPAQVGGWCPKLLWVLVWLHFWLPLLPSTRWYGLCAKAALA